MCCGQFQSRASIWIYDAALHPRPKRYQCKACGKRFDDLTGTVLSGHHQPLSAWVLCLYFMGPDLSNRQIAQELDLNKDDLQYMTEHLRLGLDKKKSP